MQCIQRCLHGWLVLRVSHPEPVRSDTEYAAIAEAAFDDVRHHGRDVEFCFGRVDIFAGVFFEKVFCNREHRRFETPEVHRNRRFRRQLGSGIAFFEIDRAIIFENFGSFHNGFEVVIGSNATRNGAILR
jgi:hypothetical protein